MIKLHVLPTAIDPLFLEWCRYNWRGSYRLADFALEGDIITLLDTDQGRRRPLNGQPRYYQDFMRSEWRRRRVAA